MPTASDAPAERKRSFPPIVDERTRLLVLGSLPGERSLRAAQYYAHPQNQFWRLMSGIVGFDLPSLAYEARLSALLRSRVGIWDVVSSAERPGSLDADIKEPEINDLMQLVRSLPELDTLAFNGATAAAIGRRSLAGRTGCRLIDLPSSSPAYTRPFASKMEAWSVLTTACRSGAPPG